MDLDGNRIFIRPIEQSPIMRTLLSMALAITFTCFGTSIHAQSSDDQLPLGAFSFRNVGPSFLSGRIADIAVHPQDENLWYVAVGSGGVWKTTNSGNTYQPIFDGQGSYSIGCVTIDPSNEHIIWVGTGENNNQRSVAYGDGVYKSEDGGKSWKNMGLKESEHIGKIVVHPNNSQLVYVAAYGPLWKEGGERGLYKTTDGGKNWELSLEVDMHTGINEVHMDPENPSILYATAHQRRRHVFTYVGGGPGSKMYKSIDGGETWNEIKSYYGSFEGNFCKIILRIHNILRELITIFDILKKDNLVKIINLKQDSLIREIVQTESLYLV